MVNLSHPMGGVPPISSTWVPGRYNRSVFPIAVSITILLLLMYALMAALAGALSGKLVSALLGLPTSGPLEDGLLGMLAFILVGLALVLVPSVTEFFNYTFPPAIAAFTAAAVLPGFRQLARLARYLWGSALVHRRLHRLRGQ